MKSVRYSFLCDIRMIVIAIFGFIALFPLNLLPFLFWYLDSYSNGQPTDIEYYECWLLDTVPAIYKYSRFVIRTTSKLALGLD